MYGAAVLDACEQIKARMEPIASRNNFNSFAEVLSYLQFLLLNLNLSSAPLSEWHFCSLKVVFLYKFYTNAKEFGSVKKLRN